MKAVLLLAFLAQQEAIIQKAYKHVYMKATAACEKAVALLEENPAEAITLLSQILDNSKVKKRECLLRIEIMPGTYSKKHRFFPYQYRGRARLKRGENSTDSEKAKRFFRDAEQDLEESVRRGLPSSKPYLERVQNRLRSIDSPDTMADREPAFRSTWLRRISQNRFVAAKKHVEEEGGFLSTEKKVKYLRETEDECRNFLRPYLRTFLSNLEQNSDPGAIRKLTASSFSRKFELPDESELVVTTPEYDWAKSIRGTLVNLRGKKLVQEELYGRAIAAAPLSTPRWFHAIENLAFLEARLKVEDFSKRARTAPRNERLLLERAARDLVAGWKVFEETLRQAVPALGDLIEQVSGRDWKSLLDKFPVDCEEFPELAFGFEAISESDAPEKAIGALLSRISVIQKNEERFTIESRAELTRYRIAIMSLRMFLEDRSDEEVIRAMRLPGKKLKELKGSFDMKHLGPRIQKVFDGLR